MGVLELRIAVFSLQLPLRMPLSIPGQSLLLHVSVLVCVISPLCRLIFASDVCVRKEGGKASWKRRERDAEGAQKATLSKEGFKDYQLRLLGNLRSCILSTSKGRSVLEYCKWESEGVEGGKGWRRGRI